MNTIKGTSNKVLKVNVSDRSFSVITVSDQMRKEYLGGKGLGLKLLYDNMKLDADPLGPDNMIAFMPGVLMGTGAPCSGRFAAVTRSPQTGLMASASCGGSFGMALKTAGWDGLLISGASEAPVTVAVHSQGVEFLDATNLWGMDTEKTQESLNGQDALVIGPAGENQVNFANIASGHRFLGRGGMGAVLGAKKVKAIVATGKAYKIEPANPRQFEKIKKAANKYLLDSPWTSIANRNYGTLAIVNNARTSGIMPVRNFTDGTSDQAHLLSGESIKEKYDTKHNSCKPCSILCGKKARFDGEMMSVPEYETVGLMGSNLEIYDPVIIAKWNKLCGQLGMDTMSMGGTLAWVMEAGEKGMVKTDLKFGSPDGVAQAIEDTARLKGFGVDMATGSKGLSEKYGGKEFAMHVKGMEISAYDPRGSYGIGLGYAVANRGGCHLSSTIMVQENFMCILSPYTTYAKAYWVSYFENLWNCINSLHTCLFTSYAYLQEILIPKYSSWLSSLIGMQYFHLFLPILIDFGSVYRKLWNSVTGLNIGRSQFLKAGRRIHLLERHMNAVMGVRRQDDTLPDRLLKEGRKCDPQKRTVPLEKMLNDYYKIRGYDDQGVPKQSVLKKLNINAA